MVVFFWYLIKSNLSIEYATVHVHTRVDRAIFTRYRKTRPCSTGYPVPEEPAPTLCSVLEHPGGSVRLRAPLTYTNQPIKQHLPTNQPIKQHLPTNQPMKKHLPTNQPIKQHLQIKKKKLREYVKKNLHS